MSLSEDAIKYAKLAEEYRTQLLSVMLARGRLDAAKSRENDAAAAHERALTDYLTARKQLSEGLKALQRELVGKALGEGDPYVE